MKQLTWALPQIIRDKQKEFQVRSLGCKFGEIRTTTDRPQLQSETYERKSPNPKPRWRKQPSQIKLHRHRPREVPAEAAWTPTPGERRRHLGCKSWEIPVTNDAVRRDMYFRARAEELLTRAASLQTADEHYWSYWSSQASLWTHCHSEDNTEGYHHSRLDSPQVILESQNGLGWKGLYRSSRSNPPTMSRDTFHQPRLLKDPSSLALNMPGSGHPQLLWATWARASPPS